MSEEQGWDADFEEPEDDAGAAPRPAKAPARPKWVDEQAPVAAKARPGRVPRAPVPGRHEEDGLWEHALVIGGIVTLATWIAAVVIPHSVPAWQIAFFGAVVTAVTGWVALSITGSGSVAAYLIAWGAGLTGWLVTARLTTPYRGGLIFCLLLLAAVLIPAGVTVIRRHRDRADRAASTGIDTMHVRECRYWEGLLAKLGCANVTVKDVILVDGGRQVHCRLNKAAAGRRISATPDADVARQISVQRRLRPGSVYIEKEPEGQTAADFIIHVRETAGPRLARFLPADNRLLSVNDEFELGVLDTGRPWRLRLREVVVFICGVIGSGKSTLLNIFIAQLSRMPDAVIFMIDLKGGQEARAWLMPWIQGLTDQPVIHWLATTREEAGIMLDALWEAGTARAESGRYGRKLRPSKEAPAFIVICDETAVMTGHMIREDNLSNTKLAVRLLQITETFRSVAISPVVAAVRAVVDVTGKSGIKAMSEVTIGMKVRTTSEGQAIFHDDYAAAQQLASLKDKGMFIPKVGSQLHPPVHGYNITDGTLDDDGHPTEDRITPIVLAVSDPRRRAEPEQLVKDAMGEAYEKRWEQPHIRQLLETWKREAGVRDRAEPVRAPGDGGDDPFDDIVKHSLRDIDPALEDDEPGYEMHPARKRMFELLIQRGTRGYQPSVLLDMLAAEGLEVHRGTLMKWLAEAVKLGYAYQAGKPKSRSVRYTWILGEGAEFDIPGWR